MSKKKSQDFSTITKEEVTLWTSSSLGDSCAIHYLLEILTGEYDLKEAREQLLSFRESGDE